MAALRDIASSHKAMFTQKCPVGKRGDRERTKVDKEAVGHKLEQGE